MIHGSKNPANRFSWYLSPKPTPAPDQPGTLGEQLLTVAVSLHLAERTGTPAAQQWERARALVMGRAER